MSDEWGPWLEHDGLGCPCVGRWVQAVHDCVPAPVEGVAGLQGGQSWDWSNAHRFSRIMRYRIRKPRGMTILQEIVANPDREAAHDIPQAELGRA